MNRSEHLVSRYFQYYHDIKGRVSGDDSAMWEAELLLKNKGDGLKVVSELIEAADTDELIAFIAAGPLEDLLNIHLHAIQKELEVLVRKSPKIRKAIQGVWTSGKAREVLDQILDKFSLTYGAF